MSDSELRVVFLLGAGASIPAGMPCTQEITGTVLSGEGVAYRRRDDRYDLLLPGAASPVMQRTEQMVFVDPVVEYLNRLHDRVCGYYEKRRGCGPTYEDLYYLAAEVRDSQARIVHNPLAYPESQAVLQELERREESRARHLPGLCCLPAKGVLDKTPDYIEGVVRGLLANAPERTDHLHLIQAARKDRCVQSVDIATLNHDRVIDVFLTKNNIRYLDGFGDGGADGFRQFCPEVYDRSDVLRVFKLHGAVNWISRWNPNDWWDRQIVIAADPCAMDRSPNRCRQLDGLPIQIGTYNKIADYVRLRHLTDIHRHFVSCLDDANLMIVSGYSFGDEGINAPIINWLFADRTRRAVIIDPHPENARRELWGYWDCLAANKAILTIPQGIECVEWDEVRRRLACT